MLMWQQEIYAEGYTVCQSFAQCQIIDIRGFSGSCYFPVEGVATSFGSCGVIIDLSFS